MRYDLRLIENERDRPEPPPPPPPDTDNRRGGVPPRQPR